MSVEQYVTKFAELSRYAPLIISTKARKASKFERCLRLYIGRRIIATNLKTFTPLVDLALKMERDCDDFRVRRDGRLGVAPSGSFKKKARPPSKRELKGRNNQGGVRIQGVVPTDVRGNQYPACPHCGLGNHTATECFRKTKTFFRCDKLGHLVKDCPFRRSEERSRAQWKVFALTKKEARASTSVIRGTHSICGIEAKVLIDPRSSNSFVALHFACYLDVKPVQLVWTLVVCTPMRESIETDIMYKQCGVVIEGHLLPIDLILLDIRNFDIILGMD
ncbi:uncharacterized protein LOC105420083 [Amborella trichopoda]|uniref:uncharacterized protein LOC105420083 n=1 Tax=Amborella trichopoda TaxID=13333 RepID=UPI0005D3C351|nr:uncharacterized protein LOC105420083 [Amborella trichopoda]|eukprot:XP_011620628.1 uncharacterized protein LOC105420083 [Amborella trichopoda]